jgi:hypothetical protein
MFMAHVSCNGCHTAPHNLKAKKDSGATVTVATAASCDNCHKPGLGEQMVPMWQKNTHTAYDAVVAMLPKTPPTTDAQKAALLETQKLLDLVRLDGSWGVHNPRYTAELLNRARQTLIDAGHANPGGAPPKISRSSSASDLAQLAKEGDK